MEIDGRLLAIQTPDDFISAIEKSEFKPRKLSSCTGYSTFQDFCATTSCSERAAISYFSALFEAIGSIILIEPTAPFAPNMRNDQKLSISHLIPIVRFKDTCHVVLSTCLG